MSVATFPFRRAGSMPAVISLDPITAINAPRAPLIRSKRLPRCPLQARHLACHTSRSLPGSVAPTINLGADIKSP